MGVGPRPLPPTVRFQPLEAHKSTSKGFRTLNSTMLAITQFQAIDTHRFTRLKILKRQIFHADEGALPLRPPLIPI